MTVCDLTGCMQRIGVIAFVRLRTADLCKQLAFPRIFIIRIQCIDTDLIGLIRFISKDAGSRQVFILFCSINIRVDIANIFAPYSADRKPAPLIDLVIIICRLHEELHTFIQRGLVVGNIEVS